MSRGFTLIETLTTIAILSFLATLAWPAYLNQVNRARYAAAESIARSFVVPLWEYRLEEGRFPPDVDNDQEPLGLAGYWVDADDAPFRSAFDYDHHSVSQGDQKVCLVQITFFGLNKQRDTNPSSDFATKDDRIIPVAKYACNYPTGSVR